MVAQALPPSEDEVIAELMAAMLRSNADRALVYAVKKTKRFVTEANVHLLPPEALQEWEAAVSEYHAMVAADEPAQSMSLSPQELALLSEFLCSELDFVSDRLELFESEESVDEITAERKNLRIIRGLHAKIAAALFAAGLFPHWHDLLEPSSTPDDNG
jgi:hypothetical protein